MAGPSALNFPVGASRDAFNAGDINSAFDLAQAEGVRLGKVTQAEADKTKSRIGQTREAAATPLEEVAKGGSTIASNTQTAGSGFRGVSSTTLAPKINRKTLLGA